MQQLLGKTIFGIYLNDNQTNILFETNDGLIKYTAYGDCCSESWFADIIGVQNALSHKVINTESLELDLPQDERCRQDYDQFYGVKITTSGGYLDIVFRNSSNGYYGGWLSDATFPDEFPDYMVKLNDDYSG